MVRPAMSGQRRSEVEQCLRECEGCHAMCLDMVPYGLQQGGKLAEPTLIRVLLDCAEICQTCANFMHRDSSLMGRICSACAEVCDRCAQDCDRTGDAHYRNCAETCRRCADSCRKVAALPA